MRKGTGRMQGQSEVALIKAHIAAEAQAAYQGMCGLADGELKHRFIAARMERMERCYEHLEQLVGPLVATQDFIEIVDRNVAPRSSCGQTLQKRGAD